MAQGFHLLCPQEVNTGITEMCLARLPQLSILFVAVPGGCPRHPELVPSSPTLHLTPSHTLAPASGDKVLLQSNRDFNSKRGNIMGTCVGFGAQGRSGRKPWKIGKSQSSWNKMGLRIKKSDSNPNSAAYVLYDLTHVSCSINSGWMNKQSQLHFQCFSSSYAKCKSKLSATESCCKD